MSTDATASPAKPRHPLRWAVFGGGSAVVFTLGVVFASQIGKNPSLSADSPLIGKPAPSFDLPGLDGGRVRSVDVAGRAYVVNFWASWCVPCRDEAPRLEAFAQRHTADGIQVIGVVWNDDKRAARAFREEFGLTFPQATDPGARAAIEFGVFGVPETYVVDPRGVVMAKIVGAVGPKTLDNVISRILAGESYTSRNDDYQTTPPTSRP